MTDIRLVPVAGTPTVLLQELDPALSDDGIEPAQVFFGRIKFSDQFGRPIAVSSASLILEPPLKLIDFVTVDNGVTWNIRLFGGERDVAYSAVLKVPGYPNSLLSLVVRDPVLGTPFRTSLLVGASGGVVSVLLGRTLIDEVFLNGKEPIN